MQITPLPDYTHFLCTPSPTPPMLIQEVAVYLHFGYTSFCSSPWVLATLETLQQLKTGALGASIILHQRSTLVCLDL